MDETLRKKSTSSDSELSDGWSLVEHSDTTPLAAVRSSDMTPQLHATPHSRSSHSQTSSAHLHPVPTSDETSSDAESVEIIQEDSRLTDFTFPHTISRITSLHTGEVEREEKEVVMHGCSSEYLLGPSIYSNEWFRLLVFISSLVALLLLLISYTSLFFKEQAYSKSDGLIVLPDEDLSSLITDLTLFKEENNRLKEELNTIKYEYGNNKKINVKSGNRLIDGSNEDIIGLEVISNDSPLNVDPIPFEPLTVPLGNTPIHEKSSDDVLSQKKRVENLIRLEDDMKTFADNIGLKNIILSSYNIASNIDGINSIVNSLKDVIDKESSSKKENKKFQLEQKLAKLQNKIEQDFKKSVEKVAKRVSKFHDEFRLAFCRIKGGVSDIDNVDCGKYDRTPKGNRQKLKKFDEHNYIKQTTTVGEQETYADLNKGSIEKETSSSVSGSEENLFANEGEIVNDFKTRFKRNNGANSRDSSYSNPEQQGHWNLKNNKADSDHKQKKNYKHSDKHHGSDTDGHFLKRQNFESEKVLSKEYMELSKEFKKSKLVQNTNVPVDKEERGGKKEKQNENSGYSASRGRGQEERRMDKKHKFNQHDYDWKSNEHTLPTNYESVKNDMDKSEFHNSKHRYQEKKDKKIKYDNEKCSKKNCDKIVEKSKQKFNKYDQKFIKNEQDSFNKYRNSDKSSSGPSTIHNESIYSKIVNGNGKRRIETNGEWYLDLGEVRNQKRIRRATRDRNGWLFDRALVRDWCRYNTGSSLCASFSPICSYCV